MAYESHSMVAGGDVRPCRFIKVSTAADYTCLEADANEAVIGISTNAVRDAPVPNADTDAAEAGDDLHYNPIGSVCDLELGGTVARGDEIKSDADGKGVVRATTGTTLQNFGAIALESGVSGEFIKVLVVRGSVYPALA